MPCLEEFVLFLLLCMASSECTRALSPLTTLMESCAKIYGSFYHFRDELGLSAFVMMVQLSIFIFQLTIRLCLSYRTLK